MVSLTQPLWKVEELCKRKKNLNSPGQREEGVGEGVGGREWGGEAENE